ncbi:unnamed protein product [Ilex paraguariensis]|uniref:Uncharacterized protein n=1 Tax=Ilex paraguariensis TaxID=185542 RepID=A0ABC8RHQ0_9AQUA
MIIIMIIQPGSCSITYGHASSASSTTSTSGGGIGGSEVVAGKEPLELCIFHFAVVVVVVGLGGGGGCSSGCVGKPVTLLFLSTWPMQLTLGDEGSSEEEDEDEWAEIPGRFTSLIDTRHISGKKEILWRKFW